MLQIFKVIYENIKKSQSTLILWYFNGFSFGSLGEYEKVAAFCNK